MIKGAVLGSPISHSLSPVLHNSAYTYLGFEGRYEAIEVSSGSLGNFLQLRGDEFDYLSLTMPLKEEVLSLDVDPDPLVQRIQSGNTLVKRDGRWKLTSTDGSGFIEALKNSRECALDSVLVLGAGGTARAVCGALDSQVTTIDVLGRSSIRRAALESAIQQSEFRYLPWTDDFDPHKYDLVVNTTPAGAADLLATSIHPGVTATLFDVIYKPWPTQLAQRWSDCGGNVISGLELLLYQGVEQLAQVLPERFDADALANHLRPILLAASM
jgi:shikimate dehydrogenase